MRKPLSGAQEGQHRHGLQTGVPGATDRGGRSRLSIIKTGGYKQMGQPDTGGLLVDPTRSARTAMSRHVTFVGLILSCVVASLLWQCHQAKMLDFQTQEGRPCICNSTFYKWCPKPSECLENIIAEAIIATLRPRDPRDRFVSDEEPPHDDMDPDHVSDPWQLPPRIDDLTEYRRDNGRDVGAGVQSTDIINRHRKVYLRPIKRKDKTAIHGINIRIPVDVPTYGAPEVPEPEPVYKMRKYVTYERKPEVVRVPVVKTIIKPVGVSPKQIIEEDSANPLF